MLRNSGAYGGSIFLIFTLVLGCPDSEENAGTGTVTAPPVTTEDTAIGGTGAGTGSAEDINETTPANPQDTSETGSETSSTNADGGENNDPDLPEDFNQPCENNEQCTAGYCIEGPDGKVCTVTCIDWCPESWECEGVTNLGTDVTYICVPKFTALCAECSQDTECGGGDAACIEIEGEGNHCTRGCGLEAPCPDGYLCKQVDDLTKRCYPVTGSCICTSDLLGSEEPCFVENSFGICKGNVTCAGPGGWSDCDAPEPALETCDGKDNDCDNETDEGVGGDPCQISNDFGNCIGTTDCKGAGGLSCNALEPAAETCDDIDNNCNGFTDEANAEGCVTYYEDKDKDGLGNTNAEKCLCGPSNDYTAPTGGDCNDFNPGIGGGNNEVCNGLDDDCDGAIDPEGSINCTYFFIDADSDGFGVTTDSKCLCGASGDYKATAGGDCNDDDSNAFPGAAEKCSGVDDNCNGVTDEANAIFCTPYLLDSDGDGYGVTSLSQCLCAPTGDYKSLNPGDCDDSNPDIFPSGLEICDGVDNTCNGVIDEDCDNDKDGYCNALKPTVGTPFSCPFGGGDCLDVGQGSEKVHPDAEEICDFLDNDCDGATDEGAESPCGGCNQVCLFGAGPESEVPFEQEGQFFDGAGTDDNGFIVLDNSTIKLNMIWVANSGEGTISKINTSTGDEVARYNLCNDPSRTAVDSNGNAWIACRGDGRVVKVSLSVDQCIDKNGNGKIDTSTDLNGNKVIDPDEMLAEGTDECVLFHVAPDGADGKARAMGVDKEDHGWVGMWNTDRLWKLHRDTGEVLQQIDIPTKPYGLAIDQSGIIWISGRGTNQLVRVDPNVAGSIQAFKPPSGCFEPYGLTIDENGRIWTANCCCEAVAHRFNPEDNSWAKVAVQDRPRGIAANGNGFIFVANDESNMIHRIDINTLQSTGTVHLGEDRFPIGMGVDFDGMVWAVNHTSSSATRIDPDTLEVLFETSTGPAPYTYSDMTGFQQKTVVAPKGTYIHVFEGWPEGTTKWMQVGLELTTPEGTSAELRVRVAHTLDELPNAVWSPFFGPFPPTLPTVNLNDFGQVIGRFLEVEVQLFSQDATSTPILKSVDIVAAKL